MRAAPIARVDRLHKTAPLVAARGKRAHAAPTVRCGPGGPPRPARRTGMHRVPRPPAERRCTLAAVCEHVAPAEESHEAVRWPTRWAPDPLLGALRLGELGLCDHRAGGILPALLQEVLERRQRRHRQHLPARRRQCHRQPGGGRACPDPRRHRRSQRRAQTLPAAVRRHGHRHDRLPRAGGPGAVAHRRVHLSVCAHRLLRR